MYNGCQASFTYLAVLDYVLKHKWIKAWIMY
jgi:hypothetical protein